METFLYITLIVLWIGVALYNQRDIEECFHIYFITILLF